MIEPAPEHAIYFVKVIIIGQALEPEPVGKRDGRKGIKDHKLRHRTVRPRLLLVPP